MISKDIAKKQIARLAGLNRYPKGETEAIRELVEALMLAPSEPQAAHVIDEFAHHEADCPKPADIRRLIGDLPKPTVRRDCKACRGTGWVPVWYLVTFERTPSGGWFRSHERLEGQMAQDNIFGDNARTELARKLEPNQEINSASAMCNCHPGRAAA